MIEQPSPSPFPRPPDPIDKPPPDIPPPAGPPDVLPPSGPDRPQPNLSFAGERCAQQCLGLPVRAHELKTAREPVGSAAARNRNRRMAGEVEELRQPEHHVADRLLGRSDLH